MIGPSQLVFDHVANVDDFASAAMFRSIRTSFIANTSYCTDRSTKSIDSELHEAVV